MILGQEQFFFFNSKIKKYFENEIYTRTKTKKKQKKIKTNVEFEVAV